MNKIVLAFSVGCVLLTQIISVHAADDPHGLSIYGKLQKQAASCNVLMDKNVINLHHEAGSLPSQDQVNPQRDDRIYIVLGGDSCDADEGYKNIGLIFLGTADNAMGNSLANTATGSSAAQGIGVRLSGLLHDIIIPNKTIAHFPAATGNATSLTASFPLDLTLVQLNDQKATAGNVQASMTVQIERL